MKKIAFLFAGQGAQAVGMGKDMAEHLPVAKAVFDMGESLRPGVTELCFAGDPEELKKTENTQPCLYLTDYAIAQALVSAGVVPAAVAGFSLGEIPALAFAGVMTDADGFRFVSLRGETMAAESARHPGGMAAALGYRFGHGYTILRKHNLFRLKHNVCTECLKQIGRTAL